MNAPKPVIVKDPMHSALRQEKIAANFRALSGLLQEACGVDLNSLTPDVLLPPRVGPVTRRAAVASATLAKPASSAVRSGGSKSSTKQAVRDETMEVITLRPRNDKGQAVPRRSKEGGLTPDSGTILYDIGDMRIVEPTASTVWAKGDSVHIAWESSDGSCPAEVYVSLYRMTRSQDWMIPVIAAYRGCEPLSSATDDAQDDENCTDHSESEGLERPRRRRKKLQSVLGKGFRGAFVWTVPDWIRCGSDYYIEIGTSAQCIRTPNFQITTTEPEGDSNDLFGLLTGDGSAASRDCGVWCLCESVVDSKKYEGMWTMCEECCTWQHATCTANFARKHRDLEIAQHDAGLALLAETGVELTGYDAKWAVAGAVPITGMHSDQPLIPPHGSDVCVWCAPRRPTAALVTKMIRMIGKVEVYPHLRGEELSTPAPVIEFLGAVIGRGASGLKCADLGAGNGELSQLLPPGSVCIEISEKRFQLGKTHHPELNWLNDDVLSPKLVKELMDGEHGEPFDLVISNPPFEHAFAFLYVALMMITRRRTVLVGTEWRERVEQRRASSSSEPDHKGRLLFILPSDFFEGAVPRRRLYRILGLRINREFKLGRWCYYNRPVGEDGGPNKRYKPNGTDKISCDSLFELVPERALKYSYAVIHAKLAGLLGEDKGLD